MTRNREACLALFQTAREQNLMVMKHGERNPVYLTPEKAEDWINGLAEDPALTEVKAGRSYTDAIEMWSLVHPLACWAYRMRVEKEHFLDDHRKELLLEQIREGQAPGSGEMWEMSLNPDKYQTGNIDWCKSQHAEYHEQTRELAQRYGWPDDLNEARKA